MRGLGCLNNRHYDPTTGVFVSVDPLVTKTMQPYIYAGGNPVTFSDPSGLEQCPTAGCNVDDHGRSPGRGGAAPIVPRVPVKPTYTGATTPAQPADRPVFDFPKGGWPVSPWVWQSAMQCVAHSSPSLNSGSCQIAGTIDAGEKGKWDDLILGDEQAIECTLGSNRGACGLYFVNSREALSFANSLTGLSSEQRNAVQHALWFALNRYDTLWGGLDIDDGNLITFGKDHEADWRHSYLDVAKDVANNQAGILLGSTAYDLGIDRGALPGMVVRGLNSLNCIQGDIFYGTPTSC